MTHHVFSEALVAECASSLKIADLSRANIGDVLALAVSLQGKTGIPFIRMDQGVPGLEACRLGTDAEKAALDRGVANQYPPMSGVPELKNAISRFAKAFLGIDIPARVCVPGVGSASVAFASFASVSSLQKGKDTILFIDPGFPVHKSQLNILGLKHESFDVYSYRGESLGRKLEEYLSKGNIAAILYSNPNNPAWVSFDEDELKIIGRLATQYDVVVLEDLAYFCMDSRTDYSIPFQPPYQPTVARYTDNYILMMSASKMFSYAGQRLGMALISERLFDRQSPCLAERFKDSGVFGLTFASSILYTMFAGVAMSVQYGVAAMLEAACDGKYDFVSETGEYARRAARMKKMFLDNGFHIVYDKDIDRPIGDGFFFSIGYGSMTGSELMLKLLYYGISSISLSTAGSGQNGIRACVSRMSEDMFPLLEERLKAFDADNRG